MGLWNPPQNVAIDPSAFQEYFDNLTFATERQFGNLIADSGLPTPVSITADPSEPNHTVILEPSIVRRGVSMRNTGSEKVWIGLTLPFTVDTCVADIEPGGYYEFPCVYSGKVWAFSATGAGELTVIDYYKSPNV